jgi:hypothetical protein
MTILERVASAASWPATLLHELTHFLLALPWADENAIIRDEGGVAHYCSWGEDVSAWSVWLVSLGPTLLGSVVGVIGLWRLVSAPPGTAGEALVAAAIAGYWIIYVVPSGDDLDIQTED